MPTAGVEIGIGLLSMAMFERIKEEAQERGITMSGLLLIMIGAVLLYLIFSGQAESFWRRLTA